MLGLERVLTSRPPRLASGTELRRHQIDALAGMLTELIAAAQAAARASKRKRRATPRLEAEEEDEDELEPAAASEVDGDELAAPLSPEEDPGAVRRFRFRHPTASGKTIAAAGFVEAARTLGVLILTHRRLLVSQFNRDLAERGLRRPDRRRRSNAGRSHRRPNPLTIQTYAWFARHWRDLNPRGVSPRDRRRGAHRPRREDERCDPQLHESDLHRHDRDRAADREAGLRRLPGFGRRPAAAEMLPGAG